MTDDTCIRSQYSTFLIFSARGIHHPRLLCCVVFASSFFFSLSTSYYQITIMILTRHHRTICEFVAMDKFEKSRNLLVMAWGGLGRSLLYLREERLLEWGSRTLSARARLCQ